MQLAPLFSAFIVSAFVLGGCSDTEDEPADAPASGGSGASGGSTASGGSSASGGSTASGGEGGSGSNLYDPSDAVEVCTSMKLESACQAVQFDMEHCADCITQCYWGTVAELYERFPDERVIGAEGLVIDAPIQAGGGAGGVGGALNDEAGCYVVAGDGG
jgi:hypothetical protein